VSGSPGRSTGARLELDLVDLRTGADTLLELDRKWRLLPGEGIVAGHSGRPADAKTIARIALRALLASRCGLETARRPFAIGAGGKPHLAVPAAIEAGGLPAFSLAHSESLALIAITDAACVGVDIEALRPVRISAPRRIQLESAAQRLDPDEPLVDGPPDRRFVQAWVRLEALAKATGEGVSALLGRLGVRGPVDTNGEPDLLGRELAVRDVDLGPLSDVACAAVCTPPTALQDDPFPAARRLGLEWTDLDRLVTGGRPSHPSG
jgi:hypothetical protein